METSLKSSIQIFSHRIKSTLQNADKIFIFAVLALIIFGLFMLLSVSSYESEKFNNSAYSLFLNQIFAICIAIITFCLGITINPQRFKELTPILVILALLSLILLNFSPLGLTAGGAERWLNLGIFSFQPSEFAKIAVLALMADAVCRGNWNSPPVILRLLLCGLIAFLIYKEPDLGSALLIFILCGFFLFIRGMNLIIVLCSGFLLSTIVFWVINNNTYQNDRIKGWLNPQDDPLGIGYNILQSYYAIAEGGFLGVGYGNSFYKLGYLPVSYADFIFSIMCEELGILAPIIIISLYSVILWKGINASIQVKDNFMKYLSLGIIFVMISEAILNLAGVCGILPITGTPLPFVSYGKTSLIVNGFLLGLLINLLYNKK